MRPCSRPRATAVQHSMSMGSSEYSHSSESAVSPASNYSSNTSSGTHSPSSTPLPKGAGPPRVNAPSIEGDVGFNPNEKRKARVLRKPYPPPSITNARSKNIFYTADKGGRPSGSTRVRVNLNDTESFPSSSTRHRRSLLVDSALAPVLSYGVSRHPHSHYNSYESQAIGGALPFTEHAEYTDDTLISSTDTSERPLTKPKPAEDNDISYTNIQSNPRSRLSIKMQVPYRDKPLPKIPVLSPDANGLASPEPIEPLHSHRLLQSRYDSSALQSEEVQAAPPFEHFVNRPDSSTSAGLGLERYVHSDIGITQTWSDSGHTTSMTHYARSDVHYRVSEPYFHRNPEQNGVRPHNHPCSSSTVGRLASPFSDFANPLVSTQTTHSMPIYPSQPPMPHSQAPHTVPRRLSWGQRIIRSLSITFRKDFVVDENIKDLPSPGFDPGHDSAFYPPTSLAHSVAPLPSQDSGPIPSSRKLRKRIPSLSNSHSSKPARFPTSRSTPALYPHKSRSQELVLEADDVPSHDAPSEFPSLDLSSTKKRLLSTPTRYARVSTPSPGMPRSCVLEPLTPTLTARGTQSQPATPTLTARKLVKRHGQRKVVESSIDERQGLPLAPPRTQLPLNLDSEPRISDASRTRSAPNIGPSDTAFERFLTSRYLAFPTDPPPMSPDAIEWPADEHSWLKPHHNRPSKAQDSPFLLHPRSSRRWTLAVFDAPEEQLVEELDRLRKVGWGPGFQGELVRVKGKSYNTSQTDNQEEHNASLEKEELEAWLIARKALMVCREIVRTEKSYREGLIKLQRGETLDPPSPLLLQYLPALISASQVFSAQLADDPSAWGVSVAFLGVQDTLEVALVAWSGVVGEFFGTTTGKLRKRRNTEHISPEKDKKGKGKETNGTGTPVSPSGSYSDMGHAHYQITPTETQNVPGSWRRSMPALSQLLTSSTETSRGRRKSQYSEASAAAAAVKMPTVRDLAIQPTQRVMRYVLLYKDLLNSTPVVSPARGLVEGALEGANHIAQRCNRAQDNAAFLT